MTVRGGLLATGAIEYVVTEEDDPSSTDRRVEISAPIVPSVEKLYPAEGTVCEASQADKEAVAHDAALTYDFLLHACAQSYPAIVLPESRDEPLTQEEIETNYAQVARCSYEEHSAKPYWIPHLVDAVDICARELGPDWRLIGQEDLDALTEEEAEFLAETLTTNKDWWASTYFSLEVWARAADGTIAEGHLAPGASPRTRPLAAEECLHYEGGLALRCLHIAPSD